MQIISYSFIILKHIQIDLQFWKLLMLKVRLYFFLGKNGIFLYIGILLNAPATIAPVTKANLLNLTPTLTLILTLPWTKSQVITLALNHCRWRYHRRSDCHWSTCRVPLLLPEFTLLAFVGARSDKFWTGCVVIKNNFFIKSMHETLKHQKNILF